MNPPDLEQNTFNNYSNYSDLATGLLPTAAGGIYWARVSADGGGIDYYSAPMTQSTPTLTFAQSGPGALPNGGALALGPDGLLYANDAAASRGSRAMTRTTGASGRAFLLPAGWRITRWRSAVPALLFVADFNENGDGGLDL